MTYFFGSLNSPVAIFDFESGGRLKSRSVIDRVGIGQKVGAGGGGRKTEPCPPPLPARANSSDPTLSSLPKEIVLLQIR